MAMKVDQLLAAMESKHDQDRMQARAFLDSLSMHQIGDLADSLDSLSRHLGLDAKPHHRAWILAVESFAKIGLTSMMIERLERSAEAFKRED